jgi:type I restriction-modification system DNA methylase subunit
LHSDRQHTFSGSRRLKLLCELRQLLLANFENYFDRFASHIRGGIFNDFKFCYQFTTLSKSSAISAVIDDLLEPELRPCSSGIDDDSMGAPSAEVVRKFNLKYNEKAGENQTG